VNPNALAIYAWAAASIVVPIAAIAVVGVLVFRNRK
jgi:hypothetical protein